MAKIRISEREISSLLGYFSRRVEVFWGKPRRYIKRKSLSILISSFVVRGGIEPPLQEWKSWVLTDIRTDHPRCSWGFPSQLRCKGSANIWTLQAFGWFFLFFYQNPTLQEDFLKVQDILDKTSRGFLKSSWRVGTAFYWFLNSSKFFWISSSFNS